MDKFTQSLATLLPQGYAWPRDPNSVVMRVMTAKASAFRELHEFTNSTVYQWMPHATASRLSEWEAATGLPDKCFGNNQSADLRRKLLLSRIRGLDLPFENSSPASPGVIATICRDIGYDDVVVRYNTPMRVGQRVGRRLGRLNGNLWVFVPVASSLFRCGGRVGSRLVSRLGAGPELACYLNRIVPARFAINVVFQ